MKVALVGASGNVGSRLLAELLSRGHEVTGIVRHPEKLQRHDMLVAKQGNINDEAGLAPLLAGHDAVISAVRFESANPRSLIGAAKRASRGCLYTINYPECCHGGISTRLEGGNLWQRKTTRNRRRNGTAR